MYWQTRIKEVKPSDTEAPQGNKCTQNEGFLNCLSFYLMTGCAPSCWAAEILSASRLQYIQVYQTCSLGSSRGKQLSKDGGREMKWRVLFNSLAQWPLKCGSNFNTIFSWGFDKTFLESLKTAQHVHLCVCVDERVCVYGCVCVFLRGRVFQGSDKRKIVTLIKERGSVTEPAS